MSETTATTERDAAPYPALPRPCIIVFACNWCSYTAADLAGTTRLSMPACFTMIRVMCSGRVDPVFILQAFACGADAVLVTGCHPGDCHYTSGNLHARRRIDFLKQVLGHLGIGERLEMAYISAAEGQRFQRVLTEFADRIAALGPLPVEPPSAPPDDNKRDLLRSLLGHLAAELHVDVPAGAIVPETMVTEGFGQPRYDAERCIGCGACAASCPQHNIELADRDGTRTIAHFHSRCVRCSTCQDVCPVDAIEVVSRFDLAQFLRDEREQAVQLELSRCARCGRAYAPTRHVDHAAQALAEGPGAADNLEICPDCRRKAHAAAMRRHMVSQR